METIIVFLLQGFLCETNESIYINHSEQWLAYIKYYINIKVIR